MSDSADLSLLDGDPLEVAPLLLGGVLSHGEVAVRLTEVEAYAGQDDPGSHAFRGPTPRTEVMFGPPGHLYVYLSYGMHHCANVVCRPEGRAGAVLLRGGEVIEGVETARDRRGPRITDRDLARGPARMCAALGIDLGLNHTDLASGPVRLRLPESPATEISTGPRVGLSGAADWPWRFWITGAPTVSAYRPAVRRTRPR